MMLDLVMSNEEGWSYLIIFLYQASFYARHILGYLGPTIGLYLLYSIYLVSNIYLYIYHFHVTHWQDVI